MNEQDMILKIMEMEGRPLMTKEISKLIYDNFDGYKLYRGKVRDHLWDNSSLKKYVIYNGKPEYTYVLKSNAATLKNLSLTKNDSFRFIFDQGKREKGVNQLFTYSVKGKDIHIKSYIKKEDFEKIIQALVLSEIQSYNNPEIKTALNKIKTNLVDLTT